MPTDGHQASANAGATDRSTQLKPTAQLDFDATNLADSWKRWKQELELYMDLAMSGRDEATKVKLFLYLVGSRRREVYDTMAFEIPASERTLTQVLEAFDGHCNPRKKLICGKVKVFLPYSGPGVAGGRTIILNQDKVYLRRKEVPFMGHVISDKGLQADPAEVKAVSEMPTPTDVASVRREVFVEADHKPLEVIFKKPLHRAPKGLRRMLMRVQFCDVSLAYKKGSTMYLADALSRAYLPYDESQDVASEIESINMTQHIRLKPRTLQEIKEG
ncbi:hypothetical protein AWC38_SpisGene24544 [Stylophora pistillata]|uniref:Uncharacterized protein n=1 Tax=Stylophora pistillata TaxID=50429 RepID=A0A2B4R5Z0_STYPI|nr:hypothetical protein AWC38_SpisGene24544 [Stylophora pistillata]